MKKLFLIQFILLLCLNCSGDSDNEIINTKYVTKDNIVGIWNVEKVTTHNHYVDGQHKRSSIFSIKTGEHCTYRSTGSCEKKTNVCTFVSRYSMTFNSDNSGQIELIGYRTYDKEPHSLDYSLTFNWALEKNKIKIDSFGEESAKKIYFYNGNTLKIEDNSIGQGQICINGDYIATDYKQLDSYILTKN